MKAYIFKDGSEEPSFISEKIAKNKKAVVEMIKVGKQKVLTMTEEDPHHSIGYYRTIERLFDDFLDQMKYHPLPNIMPFTAANNINL